MQAAPTGHARAPAQASSLSLPVRADIQSKRQYSHEGWSISISPFMRR